MVAKLSSPSTMSAASLAAAVPAWPIATPMSACRSAGASLTPSPVIAVTAPPACSARTSRSLCSGATRANTAVAGTRSRRSSSELAAISGPVIGGACPTMPSSRPIAAAVAAWSPVIILTAMPARWQAAMASTTSSRGGSISPTSPRRRRSWSSGASTGSSWAQVTLGDGEHAQPVGGVPVENGVGGRGDRWVDVGEQDLRSALQVADGRCTVRSSPVRWPCTGGRSRTAARRAAGGGRTVLRGRFRPARPRRAGLRPSGRRARCGRRRRRRAGPRWPARPPPAVGRSAPSSRRSAPPFGSPCGRRRRTRRPRTPPRRPGRPGAAQHHLVAGQGAGLVGAHHRRWSPGSPPRAAPARPPAARAIRCTPMASAMVTIAGRPSGIAATASVIAARAASATG